jgi:hypothetical protein
MSSVITTSPTLNYVSSADISTTIDTNGYLRYQIFFHESVVTYGNIIMFEYMIQPKLNTIFSPANTVYGFLSVDVATTTGILNQYVLTVPASEQTYTGISEDTIQFRVYTGDKDTNDVIVTEWSNALNVFNPAVEPNFSSAFAYFDENIPHNNNVLYVFFDSDNNPYDYGLPEDPNTGMKFIVCYYYKKSSDGSTIWGVSDPLHAEPLAGHPTYKVLKINNIERVLDGERIYLNVHADYNWQYNNNNYYSVSSASADLIAYEAINDSAPDITSVAYKVYELNKLQEIELVWNAPQNSIVSNFEVQSYQVFVNINEVGYVPYGNLLPKTVKSLVVDVNNLDCEDTIQFLVEVTTVLEQVTRSPPSSIVNIFKHAGPVSSLVVNDTSVAPNNSVSLLVNFDNSSYTGCGAPKHYVVRINNQVYTPVSGSLVYVPYTSYSIRYILPAVNGLPLKTGNVDVALVTEDTNNSSNFLEGEKKYVPYIANNLNLQPVVYQVYNSNSTQQINMTWNDISLGNWSVVNYRVEAKVDANNWTVVAGGDPNAPYTNTSYTYNVILSALSQNISFKVIATVVNIANPTSPVSYNVTSNTDSKNTFSYAGPVSNLVVTNTSVSPDNTVNLTVKYNGVVNRGLGAGDKYAIEINGQSYTPSSGSLTYDTVNPTKEYSVSYILPASNGNPVRFGIVNVYLETVNTNQVPVNPMKGQQTSTPYFANNLVIQPVDYSVYNNKAQIMNLSWNDLAVGPWSVNNYTVEAKIGTGPWIVKAGGDLNSPYTNTSYSYVVDLSTSSTTEAIQFRVTGYVNNNTVNYNTLSNIVSKNTFSHPGQVSGLVVKNTSVASGNIVMLTVEFTGVANVGINTPDNYVVKINGNTYSPISGNLSYVANKQYSVSYALAPVNGNQFPNVGTVDVNLQVLNTNSPGDIIDGDLSSAPYIANNLTLDALNYDVYTNNTQNLQLTWNNITLTPWTLINHIVYVKQGLGSWTQVISTSNNIYTYLVDTSNTALLTFKVVTTVGNGSVNYNVTSNEQTINPFSYSKPVSNVVVNWTVTNTNNSIMDAFVSFDRPSNTGVNNGIEKYVVRLLNNNSGLIQSKDVIPVVNTIRENVYFDDVVYSNVGNIIIDVYVKDNNNNNNPITLFNESQYIISYVTSSVPLFINVSFNSVSSQLSGTIVTEDVLKRAGRLIYIDNNSLKEVQINTSGVLTTGFNISDPINNLNADGTLSYNFVLDYSSFQGLSASNSLSVSVSNNFGIGTLIKNRI